MSREKTARSLNRWHDRVEPTEQAPLIVPARVRRCRPGAVPLALVSVLVGAVLTACAGDGVEQSSAEEPDGEVVEDSRVGPEATDAGTPVAEDEQFESEEEDRTPLEDYFDFAFYRGPSADKRNAMEEVISTCMAEEGFEYIAIHHEPEEQPKQQSRLTKEVAEQSGFYLVTPHTADLDVVEELAETPAPAEGLVPAEDPLSELSPEEREAWSRAMFGPPEGIGEDGAFVQGGCEGRAQEATRGFDPSERLGEALGDELSELEEAIFNDSRLAEYNEEQLRCVREAGHDLPLADSVREAVHVKLDDAITMLSEVPWVPVEGVPGAEQRAPLTTEQEEIVAAAAAEEIDIAVAYVECGGDDGYDELLREVQAEYEDKFLADFADRLALLRSELEEGDG